MALQKLTCHTHTHTHKEGEEVEIGGKILLIAGIQFQARKEKSSICVQWNPQIWIPVSARNSQESQSLSRSTVQILGSSDGVDIRWDASVEVNVSPKETEEAYWQIIEWSNHLLLESSYIPYPVLATTTGSQQCFWVQMPVGTNTSIKLAYRKGPPSSPLFLVCS